MDVLVAVLVLSFLVIIHELGHFFAAIWAKVKVEEFGLGYPPKAKKLFTWLGSDFTLNWIPFGGFVKMAGEYDHDEGKEKKSSGEFYQASLLQKLVIILSGASVNFVFGVVAFAVVFSIMGIPETLSTARIGYISPNSPAAQANIPLDVEVRAVEKNGVRTAVTTPTEFIDYIAQNRGETLVIYTSGACVEFTCQPGETAYSTYIRTVEETPTQEGALGVGFTPAVPVMYPWYEMPFRGAVYGLKQAVQLGLMIVQSLGMILQRVATEGGVPAELAGPLGIIHQAKESGLLSQGFLSVLSFAGLLSVNLAVMNMLPIPPLDGGRAVFLILEKLVGRSKTEKLETFANYGGYLLLLALILFVSARDIARIFSFV